MLSQSHKHCHWSLPLLLFFLCYPLFHVETLACLPQSEHWESTKNSLSQTRPRTVGHCPWFINWKSAWCRPSGFCLSLRAVVSQQHSFLHFPVLRAEYRKDPFNDLYLWIIGKGHWVWVKSFECGISLSLSVSESFECGIILLIVLFWQKKVMWTDLV